MSQSDLDGDSLAGRWATGEAIDGSGESYGYFKPDVPRGEAPQLAPVDPRVYGTPPMPIPAMTK